MTPAATDNAKRLRVVRAQNERDNISRWCRQNALDAPAFEYLFHLERKWRFDVVWVGKKVALEIEGSVWRRGHHTRGGGFLDDCEKYGEAAAAGWLVIRVARPPQGAGYPAVLYHPKVVEWLRDCLARDLPR